MSTVYRGADEKTGQPVAIKALKPELVEADPSMLVRFQQEGEALRKLNHPNIVKMLDAVEQDGKHYLIMEYVEGGSLSELLEKEQSLPVLQALQIALDLADALTRAHRLEIIHRDIKPSNVLLAHDGTPRLTDFGIARIGDTSQLTQTGTVMGTFAYLSPEACKGDVLNEGTDIWSFGVMLFEMVMGHTPFQAGSPGSLIAAILTEPIPDISALRPELPDALVDLLYRMLDKNIDARISSVRLVGAALEVLIKGLGTGTIKPDAEQITGVEPKSRFETPTPSTVLRRHNIPSQTTPFIGRQEEMERLAGLIADPHSRLVTLLGPGGIGKTRLALEAALRQTKTSVLEAYLVRLAPFSSAEFVAGAIADALKITLDGSTEPVDQIIAHIAERQMLLVLDSFEKVLEATPLIGRILDGAPDVTVLATSRTRLNLQAECVFDVRSLGVPKTIEQKDFDSFEAVRMFVEYARRARPNYSLAERDRQAVVDICRLVGGMPLGIELAAAWVRTLMPGEIAEELAEDLDFLETTMGDVPERHRSMRAVFEYSWKMLDEKEQDALRGLSVFRGQFTREAAREVAGARVRALAGLVDKSLLRRDQAGYYEIPEMIRQYAAEILEDNAGDHKKTLDRHCHYYANLLRSNQDDLRGGRQKEALLDIDAQKDNIREALKHAADTGAVDEIDMFLDGLPLYLEIRGWPAEGEELFGWAMDIIQRENPAIAEPGAPGNATFARLVSARGKFAYRLGHLDKATELFETSLELNKALDDQEEIALSYNNLGNLAWAGGELERAVATYDEGLAIWRKLGNRRGEATILNNQGAVFKDMGRYDDAVQAYQQALGIFRELGSAYSVAVLLDNLGYVNEALDRDGEARAHFREALAAGQELRAQPVMLDILAGLARLEAKEGRQKQAAAWAALVKHHPVSYIDSRRNAETLLAELGEVLTKKELAEAEALGQELVLEEVVAECLKRD
ncbi:MAG: protein kinase [Anaerolineae bacterium]|nr:protein kinase [Anaerolineae bacterium]